MTTRPLQFLRRGQPVALGNVPPDRTLLEVLREDLGCTGTKEGCGEGDCGACTVVLGEARDGRLRYSAVNSCIRLAHSVDGMALWTVEDLAEDPLIQPVSADGAPALHPAQEAMVQCHGSQCGFCTPGFVMSLFGMYQNHVCQCREITRALVALDAIGEVLEQSAPATHPQGHVQFDQVRGFEADVGKRRQAFACRFGRQALGVCGHRIGLELKSVNRLQPGIPVGREHAEGLAGLGQHLVALEDHLILEIFVADALRRELLRDLAVAHDRVRLVVTIGEHLVHAQLKGQTRHFVLRATMAHDEACAGATGLLRQGVERSIEFGQTAMNEFDPTIAARRQRI